MPFDALILPLVSLQQPSCTEAEFLKTSGGRTEPLAVSENSVIEQVSVAREPLPCCPYIKTNC
jgi:hypothetical protein